MGGLTYSSPELVLSYSYGFTDIVLQSHAQPISPNHDNFVVTCVNAAGPWQCLIYSLDSQKCFCMLVMMSFYCMSLHMLQSTVCLAVELENEGTNYTRFNVESRTHCMALKPCKVILDSLSHCYHEQQRGPWKGKQIWV